jgi:hypothetical protein
MNVSEQIINVLNALCEKFGIAIDWTAANVLPYVQDLCGRVITYSIAKDIATIIFMIIGFIISLFAFKFCFKKYKECDYCDDEGWQVGSILSGIIMGVLCVASIIVIPITTMEIIQACTIPELTIIQMVEGLIEAKGA